MCVYMYIYIYTYIYIHIYTQCCQARCLQEALMEKPWIANCPWSALAKLTVNDCSNIYSNTSLLPFSCLPPQP